MIACKNQKHLSHNEAVETTQQLLMTTEQLSQMVKCLGSLISDIQFKVADLTIDSSTSNQKITQLINHKKQDSLDPHNVKITPHKTLH